VEFALQFFKMGGP